MKVNTDIQYTRKIKNVLLGLMLNISLSLLCADLPGKVAYSDSFSQAIGIEKVFVGIDFQPRHTSCTPAWRPVKTGARHETVS